MRIVTSVMLTMLLLTTSLHAQVQIMATIRNPAPSQLSAWQRDPSVAQVRILNRGQDLPRMRLSITIYSVTRGNRVAFTNDDSREIPRFDVPGRGKMTTLSGQQVINTSAVSIDRSLQAMAAQTNSLPEGEYQVCLTLLDDAGNPYDDANVYCTIVSVVIADPPTLVFPVEDQVIDDEALMFRWTPVRRTTTGADVFYELVVVPILGKEQPATALERNERLFFKRLQRPEYLMTKSDRPLTINGASRFAWQVRAVNATGQPCTSNNGFSEAAEFRIDRTKPPTDTQKPDTLVLNGYTIAVTQWSPPDKSGTYSGRGCLVLKCDQRSSSSTARSTVKRPAYTWSDVPVTSTSDSTMPRMTGGIPTRTKIAPVTTDVRIPSVTPTTLAPCIDVSFQYVQWRGEDKRTVVADQGLVIYPATSLSERTMTWFPSDSLVVDIDTMEITATSAKVAGSAYHKTATVGRGTGEPGRFPFPLVSIPSPCDLLVSVQASSEEMFIGETQCAVIVTNYTIDASRGRSAGGTSPSDVAILWNQYGTRRHRIGQHEIWSNTGYTQLHLFGVQGVLNDQGVQCKLQGTPTSSDITTQTMVIPYEHTITYRECYLTVQNSRIVRGNIVGSLQPDNGHMATNRTSTIALADSSIIDSTGSIIIEEVIDPTEPSVTYTFGDRTTRSLSFLATITPSPTARIYARYPSTWVAPIRWSAFQMPAPARIHARDAYAGILTSDSVIIALDINNSRDIHNQPFSGTNFLRGQLLLGADGMSGDLAFDSMRDSTVPNGISVGRKMSSMYMGGQNVFNLLGHSTPNAGPGKRRAHQQFLLSFTSEALTTARIAGSVTLPSNALAYTVAQQPITATLDVPASWISFDSTQRTINPWGVTFHPIEGTQSSGVMIPATGTVNLSGARMQEAVHFTVPFGLQKMEFYADGSVGSTAIDANTADQEFDGFPYAPDRVLLSPIPPAAGSSPYIATTGHVDIPAFGLRYMNISDSLHTNRERPYRGRFVTLARDSANGRRASDLDFSTDGLATQSYTMAYDEVGQDGFVGKGTVIVPHLGKLSSSLTARRNTVCFSGKEESIYTPGIAPFVIFGALGDRWSCGCVEGDVFSTVGAGARVVGNGTGPAGYFRAGVGLEVTYGIRNNITTLWASGGAALNLILSDADGQVLLQGVMNESERSLRGTMHLNTTVASLAGGILMDGELDLYYRSMQDNLDAFYIQGVAKVTGQAFNHAGGGSASLQGGFFFGHRIPREDAWVLYGEDARFKLRDEFIPATLTGMYLYGGTRSEIDLWLARLRVDLHVGVGGFMGALMTTCGVDVHGILARGLVEASALVNLQAAAGMNTGLAGRTVLQGCVNTIILGKYCAYASLGISVSQRKGLVIE